MDFVTPDQYSKSNLAHFNINSRAASDFVSLHPALGPDDRWIRGQRLLDLQLMF